MDSGLIQMNAHMVTQDWASVAQIAGLVFAIALAAAAVAAFMGSGWKPATVFAALAVAGAVVFVIGLRAPKVKEIRACAVGSVSLEQVATVYDIVNVDGKELTLRER